MSRLFTWCGGRSIWELLAATFLWDPCARSLTTAGKIQVSDVEGNVKIRDTSGQIRVSHVGSVIIDDTTGDITVRQAMSLSVRQKESGQVKVSAVSGSVEAPPKIELRRE